MCENGSVEDEKHFVTEWERLDDQREAMKEEVGRVCNITNLEGFEVMKKLLGPECLKITAKHSRIMLDKRKDLMYE